MFKQGYYQIPFEEKRDLHNKSLKKFDTDKLEELRQMLQQHNSSIQIGNLKREFSLNYPGKTVSESILRKTLHQDLHYNFGLIKINPSAKNDQKNLNYRFWFVHFLIKEWESDNIVASIDEPSFSFSKYRKGGWHNESGLQLTRQTFQTNSENLSLLLACSQKKIVGYFVVEGAINSIHSCEFMIKINEKLMAEKNVNQTIVDIIDNSRVNTEIL